MHDPYDPSRSALFTWLRTMSPARRQQLDEKFELVMREAMQLDSSAKITFEVEILPNLEKERAELSTTCKLGLPKIMGGSAIVRADKDTGTIASFDEDAKPARGGRSSTPKPLFEA